VSDGVAGAIASWEDGGSGSADIYGLQVTASGVPASGWTANGTILCDASGTQVAPAIASDGTGGAYVAWADARSGESDVYAIHVGVFQRGPLPAPGPVPPRTVTLHAPRPNPMVGRTEMAFELPTRQRVEMDILDMAGRRVRRLVESVDLPPGSHFATWDGTDGRGARLHPGVYFVRLNVLGGSEVRRFVMLR
jgi:hypothetical protein